MNCRHHNAAALFFSVIVWCCLLQLTVNVDDDTVVETRDNSIDENEVKNWALRFGKDIAEGSAESTCLRKITANFEEMRAKVVWIDGYKLMEDMRLDVMNMLNWKKVAVERIANESERLAANHTHDKHLKFDYYNMKKLYDPRDASTVNLDVGAKPLKLSPHPNFDNVNVNLEHSAIHVPINVFDFAPDIVNDIKWSESLTQYFKNNLAFDPGLSWQFFGSATGFLRLYPATIWRTPPPPAPEAPDPPDLYDGRMRPWYISAAASAKDVVILLDGSGSMTGLRRDISRNVVMNILATLTDDDYVSVLRFSNIVEPVVPCFKDIMVQATQRNLREIEEALDSVTTVEIANFTQALVSAFQLLQHYNRSGQGSQCNQAIMLVTDGSPSNYEDIFKEYNWPNIPVRVFTYLIGREVTESRQVNWMACHNRGYYTHVANLAEVREQVQQYVPVMSRPMVLSGERPFVWSPVYADVSDATPINDWIWEEREKAKLRKLIREQREKQYMLSQLEDDEGYVSPEIVAEGEEDEEEDRERGEDMENVVPMVPPPEEDTLVRDDDEKMMANEPWKPKPPRVKKIQLMTTLSTPVFDQRNFTNITMRILVKNVWQDSEPIQIRTATLLGVAGVDVPIKEIVKLTPAFKLGVNGYSFVITNNGHLLYHPDLRPMFQDMLKPFYSSVDISEVELADNQLEAREADPDIEDIRGNMINRTHGLKKVAVKVHLDGMRRVNFRTNSYIYGKLDHSPFSLAVVLPEPYGSYRVEGQVEIRRKEENFTHYFRGDKWRVHPDWVYCDNPHKLSGMTSNNPEDIIKLFLAVALNGQNQNFRWRTSSTRPQVYDRITCDKDLVQSLVFDAKATDIEKCDTVKTPFTSGMEEKRIAMFGIVSTFVATRSGLTRFEDHRTDEEKANASSNGDRPFFDVHTRSTEEVFYRRAVDYHRINSSAFVFSVPFDAGQKAKESVLVTASHAINIGTGKQRAPAAVVGLQFKHTVFASRFFNFSYNRYARGLDCLADDHVDCYLLDDNGFIVVSEVHEDTGRFFGEVDMTLFNQLIDKGLFRRVKIYDYQAICLDVINPSGPASTITQPFRVVFYQLIHFLSLFWTRFVAFLATLSTEAFASSEYVYYDDMEYEDEKVPNKTRPRPCDKEIDLYAIVSPLDDKPETGKHSNCLNGGCQVNYVVQHVPYTNLLLLVTSKNCPCTPALQTRLEAKEVIFSEHERCRRLKTQLPRRRPPACYNYHPQEKDIKQCGGATEIQLSFTVLIFCITTAIHALLNT